MGLDVDKSIRKLNERGYSNMAKQNERGGGWSFPKDTEIYKCREGRKEFLRERTSGLHRGFEYRLIAEFPVYTNEGFRKEAWKMAKRCARDFLRTAWVDSVVVCFVERDTYQRQTVKVYEKYMPIDRRE